MHRSARLWAAACAAVLAPTVLCGPAQAAPSCPNASFVVVEPRASADTRPVRDGPHRRLFVRRAPITTTADLTQIRLAGDAYDTLILLRFTPEGARRLHDATTHAEGLRVAFVVDGRALSAVTWQGPYGMDADQGVQLSLGRATPGVRPVVAALQRCILSNAR